MTTDHLTLRGVAYRGDRLRAEPQLERGLTLPTEPVTLRTIRDKLLGKATLSWQDGDVLVDATLPADRLNELVGAPFLCVAIKLNLDEDENEGESPAVVSFAAVCAHSEDPFQLPYQLTGVPPAWREWLERYGYRSRRVVDELHDVAVTLDPQTAVVTTEFDETKSHLEWYHRGERARLNLPNAVARGFGYETWAALVGEAAGSGVYVSAVAVLEEVTRLSLT